MTDLERYSATVVAVAAAVAALGYLVVRVRRAVRVLDTIDRIVSSELEHNHGSSIKDDMHGVAVTVGLLSRRVDGLEDELHNHINRRKGWFLR